MNNTNKNPPTYVNGFSFGGDNRIWTDASEFCRLVPYHLAMSPYSFLKKIGHKKLGEFCVLFLWSGWRGSNSLPPPWQGGALPDELHPHVGASGRNRTIDTGIFSPLLYLLSYRGDNWRPEWGSNPRPLAWQASVLTNWTTRPYWWGLQGSNLWPSACKADALPTELTFRFLCALTLYQRKLRLSIPFFKKYD